MTDVFRHPAMCKEHDRSGVGAVVRAGGARRWAIVASIALATTGCGPTQPAATPDKGKIEQRQAGTGRIIVAITGNGLRSDGVSGDETVAACAQFRLTPAQVGDYFARAETVDDRAYNHDLDMSRCYATGNVTLLDGDGGTWTIDQARRGYLARKDGSHRYMVCNACPAPPFFERDGDNEDMIGNS